MFVDDDSTGGTTSNDEIEGEVCEGVDAEGNSEEMG